WALALYISVLAVLYILLAMGLHQPTNVLETAVGSSAVAVILMYWLWRRGTKPAHSNLDSLGAALSSEQAKSDIILNTIEDGVMLIDNQNVIRVFNPAASIITGWPSDEAVGLDYTLVFKLIDDKNTPYDEGQDPFKKAFEQKKSIRDNQASLVARTKKNIAVTISVSPLLSGDQTSVIGAVGVFRDVSQERGQEKRSADFVSTASHEMRTPVAAIEGYLALALNDRVTTIDSKARDYLEKAHESTQHLGKLFQDLLTTTRAEDGRLSNHPSVVEMGAFVEKMVEDLRFSAQKKGLSMEYVMGTHAAGEHVIDASSPSSGSTKVIKPLYYVNVDPERLREVVTNLFDNAVKYTESGSVSIGLTGDSGVVQLSIRDTGAGIPAEDIPHLFQKFYRVDSSATRTIGGTGLGLFICRKIVELYNGRIWVESKPGEGSTFFINLPRLDSQQASQLQAAAKATSGLVTSLPTSLPTTSAT
ncbi:MAG: ATP-binding protein, partial [Candidatus Saccharimonadales bacterium]